jgi:hypothetical protein
VEPVVILLIVAAAALLLLFGAYRRPSRPAEFGPTYTGPAAWPGPGAAPPPATPGAPVAAGAPTVAGAPMAVGAPAPAAVFQTPSAAARRRRNAGASHFTRPRANARVSR